MSDAKFPPAVLRPAELTAHDRGGGARTIPLVTRPVGALVWMFPGHNAGLWAFAFALIFAIALKKALLEPLAIASLMQVFFKTIEGQTPDPEWSARLSEGSGKFRELAQKAAGWLPRPPQNPAKPV